MANYFSDALSSARSGASWMGGAVMTGVANVQQKMAERAEQQRAATASEEHYQSPETIKQRKKKKKKPGPDHNPYIDGDEVYDDVEETKDGGFDPMSQNQDEFELISSGAVPDG